MERTSTSAIYDTHVGQWTREEPVLLSDFTARPIVIDELRPLAGTHVLDLGCGEGYVARLVADAGASSVFGVDASSEMVRNARSSVPNDSRCSAMRQSLNISRGSSLIVSWLYSYLIN
jgi:2-polyprenyl-3-methyl-5-hydroxy-6-metoxy-1,4-benzoquinol methylase